MELYNDPLCTKCLHPENLHTEVVSRMAGREVRRCIVGICSCVISFQVAKQQPT